MSLRLRVFLALALSSGGLLLGYAAWQLVALRDGFLAYLDQVGLQQLAAAVTPLEQRWQDDGGSWDAVLAQRGAMHRLVEEAIGRRMQPNSRPGHPPHGPRPPAPDAFATRPPHPGGGWRPPPAPTLDWMGRLALHDAAGHRLIGPDGAPAHLALDLRAPDQTLIGSLRLAPLQTLDPGLQADFVRHQIASATGFVGLALLLAAVTGWWLSRRLTQPLTTIMQGSAALAAGEFQHRVPEPVGTAELTALARHFNQLAAALEQHRAQRRQLGADLAHELRTPLTVLRGELQLLQDGVRPLNVAALASLDAETTRLTTLVEDLYELALADAGSLEYRMGPCELSDLVTATCARWQGVMQGVGLRLTWEVAADLVTLGDPPRLERLLDNLLGNAQRYTDAPGQVHVRLCPCDTGGVMLVVSDSAPGVPDAALPHLADRLYRVDRSRSRAAGGAGLGLAIVASVVAAHGGTLRLGPSSLGGLDVRIVLPPGGAATNAAET